MEVLYVSPEYIEQAWELCGKGHMEKVVEQAPGYTLESIYSSLVGGTLQLWVVLDEGAPVASFTTCIQVYPECKELVCVHLGGERMQEWGAAAVERLYDFGKVNGCSAMVTVGRRGTEKLYKQWGLEFDAVRMSRKIV